MSTEKQLEQVRQWVDLLLEQEPDFFCVSIKIKPTNNIKVFLDGDVGLPIEQCVKFNRKLYKIIEESGAYPTGDFSLEVSSPGIDEPLKLLRQYKKNIGREVEVIFVDGSVKRGKLISVTVADIFIEYSEGKGKKAVKQQIVIPFINIKSTTVQTKF